LDREYYNETVAIWGDVIIRRQNTEPWLKLRAAGSMSRKVHDPFPLHPIISTPGAKQKCIVREHIHLEDGDDRTIRVIAVFLREALCLL
jgi:hypothetical protein